jgi:hypothetical protein
MPFHDMKRRSGGVGCGGAQHGRDLCCEVSHHDRILDEMDPFLQHPIGSVMSRTAVSSLSRPAIFTLRMFTSTQRSAFLLLLASAGDTGASTAARRRDTCPRASVSSTEARLKLATEGCGMLGTTLGRGRIFRHGARICRRSWRYPLDTEKNGDIFKVWNRERRSTHHTLAAAWQPRRCTSL